MSETIKSTQELLNQRAEQINQQQTQVTAFNPSLEHLRTQSFLRTPQRNMPNVMTAQARMKGVEIQRQNLKTEAQTQLDKIKQEQAQYEKQFEDYLRSPSGIVQYANEYGIAPTRKEYVWGGKGDKSRADILVYTSPYGTYEDWSEVERQQRSEAKSQARELGFKSLADMERSLAFTKSSGSSTFITDTGAKINIKTGEISIPTITETEIPPTTIPEVTAQSLIVDKNRGGINWDKIMRDTGLDTFSNIGKITWGKIVGLDTTLGVSNASKDIYKKFDESLNPLLTSFRETTTKPIETIKDKVVGSIPEIPKSFRQEQVETNIKIYEDLAKSNPNNQALISNLNTLYKEQYYLERERQNNPLMMMTSTLQSAVGTPFDIAVQGVGLATSPIQTTKQFAQDLRQIPQALLYSPLTTIGSLTGSAIASELVFSGLGRGIKSLGEETAIRNIKARAISKDVSIGDAVKVGTNPDGSSNWLVNTGVRTKVIDIRTGKVLNTIDTTGVSIAVTSTTPEGAINSVVKSATASLGKKGTRVYLDENGIYKITKKFNLADSEGKFSFTQKPDTNLFIGTGSSDISQIGQGFVRATPEGVITRLVKNRAIPKSSGLSNIETELLFSRDFMKQFKGVDVYGTQSAFRSKIVSDVYPELVKVKGWGRTAKGNTLDFGVFRLGTEEAKRVSPYVRKPRSTTIKTGLPEVNKFKVGEFEGDILGFHEKGKVGIREDLGFFKEKKVLKHEVGHYYDRLLNIGENLGVKTQARLLSEAEIYLKSKYGATIPYPKEQWIAEYLANKFTGEGFNIKGLKGIDISRILGSREKSPFRSYQMDVTSAFEPKRTETTLDFGEGSQIFKAPQESAVASASAKAQLNTIVNKIEKDFSKVMKTTPISRLSSATKLQKASPLGMTTPSVSLQSKQIQKEIVSIAQPSALSLSQTTGQEQEYKEKYIFSPTFKTSFDTSQNYQNKLKEEQLQALNLKTMQRQEQQMKVTPTTIVQQTTTTTTRTTPNIPKPFKIKIPDVSDNLRRVQRFAKSRRQPELFKAFSRRYGKDVFLGSGRTQQEAFAKADRFVKGTLGASIKVFKGDKPVKLPSSRFYGYSKRNPFVLVQRKGGLLPSGRLSSQGERQEIKNLRKAKLPKIKLKGFKVRKK